MAGKKYEYDSVMDTIDLEDEEFDRIYKRSSNFKFPTICISKNNHLYINSATIKHFDTPYVEIYSNSKYIVLMPSNSKQPNAFKLLRQGNESGLSMSIPRDLREKKLKIGIYKLYKYKDGVCFKRYEPLTDKEMEEAKRNG